MSRRVMGCALALASTLAVLLVPALAADSVGISGKQISFRPPVDFATGATPSSADFNRAEGDQLIPRTVLRMPLSDSVAVGDFNHDRKPDVAQTNVIAGTLSIFLGDGHGGFAPPRLHPVGQYPVFVVAGDLDRDGKLDLAVANMGSNDVAILRGDGAGGFLPASFVPVPVPRNVAIGNFNSDGIPDLAVASSGPALGAKPQPAVGGVAVLSGNAAGSYVPTQFVATTIGDQPVNASYVAAGDFNGDGRDDLGVGVGARPSAYVKQSGTTELTGDDVLIFGNQGGTAAPFASAPDQRIRVGAWPSAIAVTDLNRDAKPDLAVLDSASGDITTLLGQDARGFVVRARNTTVGAIPRSLAVADFNDDGHLDLATASFGASTVSVLAGNGDGTLRPAVDFWSGDAPTGVAVGDVNADGRPDVVAGRLRNDHLALLVNDSPGRSDGVRIDRDISYVSPTNDPYAAHHTLDVYSPPAGTPSFAGRGRPYPVVLWARTAVSGNKSMNGYFMRSLALDGIVAVSMNFRVGDVTTAEQIEDGARAFRWIRDNVGSRRYGGDPSNVFAAGHSSGGGVTGGVATEARYGAEQTSIRALVIVGGGLGEPGDAAVLPPSLIVNGDEGYERGQMVLTNSYTSAYRERGESTHIIIPGRDHFTVVSDLALAGDPGRAHLLGFLRKHLAPAPRDAQAAGTSSPAGGGGAGPPIPATGLPDGQLVLGVLLLILAAQIRRASRLADHPCSAAAAASSKREDTPSLR